MDFFSKEVKRGMFLIFFGIFTWWLFINSKFIGSKIDLLLQALSPLVIGFVISFILNRPMMFFEKLLYRNKKIDDKFIRTLSLLITILVFMLIITLLILIVVPSLINTAIELKYKFPEYLKSIKEYIENSSIKNSIFDNWIQNIDINSIRDNISEFIKGGLFNWLGSTFSIASSVVGNVLSFFLGFIFSIYFLMQKEEIVEGIKKILHVILPLQFSNRILYIGNLTKKAFSDFLLAQSLEAVILGSIFFITMLIFRFPYTSMISVVIAVFSFIPVVGSFIGLFVGIILIFVESPKLAGLFILLFLVLQQIEGNIIYPKVVGKFSGLSPLLTLVAITLGGSLMGVVGIILFIPIFAVIQELIKDFSNDK